MIDRRSLALRDETEAQRRVKAVRVENLTETLEHSNAAIRVPGSLEAVLESLWLKRIP